MSLLCFCVAPILRGLQACSRIHLLLHLKGLIQARPHHGLLHKGPIHTLVAQYVSGLFDVLGNNQSQLLVGQHLLCLLEIALARYGNDVPILVNIIKLQTLRERCDFQVSKTACHSRFELLVILYI